MRQTSTHPILTIGFLVLTAVSLLLIPALANDDPDLTYEEAVDKMTQLAHKIDGAICKTTTQILKANHWHKMLKEAEMADQAVERILRNAAKLIRHAAELGIVLTRFDIEVFNEAVGRWVTFDPIHIMSSGD